MFTSFVSSRSLSVRGSWGTAPSVFWYGAPGGTQGPPGKGGAAERWRGTPSVSWVTRHGAKPATTRAYKSRPPPGRRTGFAPRKISAPPKAITNSAPKFFCLLFFTESIPRRRAVQALHPAKSPPRRRRSQIRPQNSFAHFSSQKAAPGGEPYRLCALQNQRPAARRPHPRPKILLPTFPHRKVAPAGQARSSSLAKGPAKGDHKSGPQKRALPTPERLFLLFWFMPATHSPGGAASRTRRPHPRPSGRRWGKFRSWDFSSGRTPLPCPYQSQSTAAHPPC